MPNFPTFTNAVVSQYPGYDESDVYAVVQAEVERVFTTTKCLNPGSPVRRFTLSLSQMTHAEMDTLESFFLSVGGTTMTWTLPNDDGTVLENCRFLDEAITFHYQDAGSFGVSVRVEARPVALVAVNAAAVFTNATQTTVNGAPAAAPAFTVNGA